MTAAVFKIPAIVNGRYTIVNRRTGEHRTFRIETQPVGREGGTSFAPGQRILSLLTGPDNENDYQGFAFVDDNGIHVWMKKRSADPKHRSPFEIYAEMLWSLAIENVHSSWAEKGYALLEEGRCARCGRTLTEPESLRIGVGPICRGEM